MAKISTKDIAKAIYASVKNKSGAELSHALENTVEFLAKKNLLPKASEILKHLEQVQNTDLGIVNAKVVSKESLSKHRADEVKHALKKRHKAEEIVLDLKEDKSLLGGIRIEANDEVIDLSLKNRLHQLQTHLLST